MTSVSTTIGIRNSVLHRIEVFSGGKDNPAYEGGASALAGPGGASAAAAAAAAALPLSSGNTDDEASSSTAHGDPHQRHDRHGTSSKVK